MNPTASNPGRFTVNPAETVCDLLADPATHVAIDDTGGVPQFPAPSYIHDVMLRLTSRRPHGSVPEFHGIGRRILGCRPKSFCASLA